MSATLTQSLIDLIRAKPVSGDDLGRAAVYTLDAVSNAMAGRNTDAGRRLLHWATAQGRDAGRYAFLMGGLTHILETDDLHRASVTHPGCVVVPAVMSLAENGSFSGPAILTAVLHGFEAMCRIGNAVGSQHYRVWHNTATCGPYGAAMAASGLLGLDDESALHALGNAGTQSSGLWQFLETGAMSKHLHAGRASESGVVAAQLAATGFTGPPAILEGTRGFFAAACPDAAPDAVLADAGSRWELTQTSIKPWPSCRHTHPAVDAALQVHGETGEREIRSVTVETYPAALDVCDRPLPESEYEAKFSLHHTVAAALEDGDIGFDSFDAAARRRLAPLRERVAVASAEPFASAYPSAWGARVTVLTSDGATLVCEREGARGDPEHMPDDRQMLDKARMLLEYAGCDDASIGRITGGVMCLVEADDAGDVVADICTRVRRFDTR